MTDRLLRKDPVGRPGSAREVADELAGPATAPALPHRRRRVVAAVIAAALVGLIACATALIRVGSDRGEWAIESVRPHPPTPSAKPVPPDPAPTAPAVDPDRVAAERLHPHGDLTLRLPDGKTVTVKPTAALPAGPFAVTKIDLGQTTPPVAVETLLASAAPLRGLTELTDHGRRTRLSEDGVARLAAAPAGASLRLVRVNVPFTAGVVGSLAKCPNLEGVNRLEAAAAADAGLALLRDLPRTLRNLGVLDLGASGGVTARGFGELARFPLVELRLSRPVGLTREYGRAVAAMPALESLYVNDAQGSVDPFVAALGGCPRLKELYPSDSATLTDAALEPLKGKKGLGLLHVVQTAATPAGMAAFAAATPRCRIVWDGGTIEPRTPAADPDRAAAERLHPHAVLELRLASGKAAAVRPNDALPDGAFTVTKIVFRDGRPAVDTDAVLTAVGPLLGLDGMLDYEHRLKFTEDGLARLADAPVAGTLKELLVELPLTTKAVGSLARFPKLGLARTFDARTAGDDELLALRSLPASLVGMALADLGRSDRLTARGWSAVTRPELRDLVLTRPAGPAPGFATALAALPDLHRLEIVDCPDVADAFVAAVARGPVLEWLILAGNKGVTDAGLDALAGAKFLRRVQLHGTAVTAAGVAKLAAALPRCRIDWDGGTIDPPGSAQP